jgi:hypothetical protein
MGYAEMLHAWGLAQKRAELFKAVNITDPPFLLTKGELGKPLPLLSYFFLISIDTTRSD